MLKGTIVKLRWIKGYHEAHNHVAVGRILEETEAYLKLECRTFHYRRLLKGQRNLVHEGSVGVRIIPWSRIEVIHELPMDTNWQAPTVFTKDGCLQLDNVYTTLIDKSQEV